MLSAQPAVLALWSVPCMGTLSRYTPLELVKQEGALKYPGLGNVLFGVGWPRPGDGYVDGGLELCSPSCLSIFSIFLRLRASVCH